MPVTEPTATVHLLFTSRVVFIEASCRLPTVPGVRAARATAPITVLATALAAALVRLCFLTVPVFPDEGGYLLVARHWAAGPALYGGVWVDRPPLLILFWRLAATLGGIAAARLLGVAVVVVLVLLAGCCGWLVGGRRSARWAAVVAGALACSPALGATEVDGELLAAPLVTGCALLALLAVLRVGGLGRRFWLAAAAGVLGVGAALVKQNLVDGLVFAAVLVVAAWLQGRLTGRAAVTLLAGGALGGTLPVAATLVWAAGRPVGVRGLVYALFGFRLDAARVIAGQTATAPELRLLVLLGLAVASGVLLLAVLAVYAATRRPSRGDPVAPAVLAMLGYGVLALAAGGSFWPHYLVALVPALSLAAGWLGTVRVPALRWRRAVIGYVACAALVAVGVSMTGATAASHRTDVTIARALDAAAAPGDTGFVAYGHPELLSAAGLEPADPLVWSLPLRVRDPRLERLRRLLTGPDAPTWFVVRDELDSWGLDPHGRLRAALVQHYWPVAQICGSGIWLHAGTSRPELSSTGTRASGC